MDCKSVRHDAAGLFEEPRLLAPEGVPEVRVFGFANPTNAPLVAYLVGAAVGGREEALSTEEPFTATGFVVEGSVILTEMSDAGAPQGTWTVRSGEWFSVPRLMGLMIMPGARGMIAVVEGFDGLRAMGGPVEATGRLINGTVRETLLVHPERKGAPYMHLICIPEGVVTPVQTGPNPYVCVVASGEGVLHFPEPDGETRCMEQLHPGSIVCVQQGAAHAIAADVDLVLIGFDPRSGFGPMDLIEMPAEMLAELEGALAQPEVPAEVPEVVP
jgi:quercetin dioxygenase-like cupin family protein